MRTALSLLLGLSVGLNSFGHTRTTAYLGNGGFEAIAPPPDLFCPLLPDARGNLQGVYDPMHFGQMWFSNRVTGYGAVPGYRPPALGFGGDIHDGSAWRGRWSDVTGLTYLGARYYDAESGRFLSADPFGHGSDPGLYAFCHGDPINFFDPDGRGKNPAFASPAAKSLYEFQGQQFAGELMGMVAGYNILGQANAAGAASYAQGQAEQQRYWNARSARDAWDARVEGDLSAITAATQQRAVTEDWAAWGARRDARLGAEFQRGLSRDDARASADAGSPGLSYSQEWNYRPWETAFRTAGTVGDLGLNAALLFIAPESLALRGASFGVRAELAAGQGLVRAAADTGLSQTYRLGLQSSRSSVLAANRSLYDEFVASGGRFIRDREFLNVPTGGRQVLGEYDTVANSITLFRGSNLSTVSEELIHFAQIRDRGLIGQSISPSLARELERSAAVTLRQWGYVPR